MPNVILAAVLLLSAQATMPRAEIFPTTDTTTGRRPFDDHRRDWYSRQLVALGESRLTESPGETYRFLWLRTFHHPIVIRIVCAEKGCDIVARRSAGRGGYEPGEVVERKIRKLSGSDAARFRELLARARFWRPQPADDRAGLDGAMWVLEGRRGQSYHVWDVWSPETSGPFSRFRELCLQLVRFSDLAVQPNEVY